MATQGNLEITIKINGFPDDVRAVENGWREFDIDCNGQLVRIKVKPKIFKKLEEAQANYPEWVAAINGKMGEEIEGGFILGNPSVQTFERKPKPPKEE